MSRRRIYRREEDIIRGVVGLVFILGLGWIFSPQFRALVIVTIVIIAGAGFFVLVVFLLHRAFTKPSQPGVPPHSTYAQPSLQPQLTRERAAHYSASVQVLEPIANPRTIMERELREKLRAIDWFQFEKLVELIFKDLGYVVERKGGAHADGGIDLVIEKEGLKLGVQCKHWRTWNVRPKEVREFIGALKVAGLSSGYYVTLQGCTEAAEDLATEQMIRFVDESQVLNSIRTEDGQVKPKMFRLLNDKNKYCPKCESEMEIKYGRKSGNPFWGCKQFPRCDGKVWIDE
jgi:restriction system protein